MKSKAHYSPDERAIMRDVVEGTMVQNLMRGTAKTFGGGLSMLGAVGLKNPELLPSKGIGKGTQMVDQGIRGANVDRLLEHILQGGARQNSTAIGWTECGAEIDDQSDGDNTLNGCCC